MCVAEWAPLPQPPAPAGACHQPAGTPYAPRVPARGVAVAAQAVTPVNCWRQRGEHSLQGVEEILQLVSIKQVPMVGYLPGPRSCRSPHQCPPPHIILLSPSISRILLPRRAPQTVSERRRHCSSFIVSVSEMTETVPLG